MIPKFRAWLKEERKMYPVYTINFTPEGELESVVPINTEEHKTNKHYWPDPEKPDNIILMQSTGLKDINDKEIYEGDVIKVSNGLCDIDEENPFVVVKWDEEAGGYTMKDFTGEFDALNIGWQIADKLVRVEVVGNIYENPELVKEAQGG